MELDSKPIGLIFAEYGATNATPPKTFGQILSFFVVPKYRSQGIGTTLLQRMSAELKNRGLRGNISKVSRQFPANSFRKNSQRTKLVSTRSYGFNLLWYDSQN